MGLQPGSAASGAVAVPSLFPSLEALRSAALDTAPRRVLLRVRLQSLRLGVGPNLTSAGLASWQRRVIRAG